MNLRFSRKQLGIPYAVFLICFVVAPLLVVLYYAFTNGSGQFTAGNFINFFTDENTIGTLCYSLVVAATVTVCCTLVAYPVAYILARSDIKKKNVLLVLFIAPMWINFTLRVVALKEVLTMVEGNLAYHPFLNTVLGMTYDFLPFMILPIYTTILKIDKSYLEAAKDLGATEAKAFLKVTLPLSKAGIASGISMVFLPSMTNYVVSNWMTNNKVTIIGDFIDGAFLNDVWGAGSVTAIILLLAMFLFTWLTGGFKEDDSGAAKAKGLW